MKKYIYFLSFAIICLGCAKIDELEPNEQKELNPSNVELLVSAPSMSKTTTIFDGEVSKTTWDANDEIIVTYESENYTYVTAEGGATAIFKAKDPSHALPAASSYTLSAAYGSTDDIAANQTITEGKNTTKQPISTSVTDAAPVDGYIKLAFHQLGSLLQFDFAQEDLTINTMKIVSLDDIPLIGTSTEINLTFTDGLSLSSGTASAQIVLNNKASQSFSKGLLLVANADDEETAVARLIWMNKTVNFGNISKHLAQPLSAWVIGGIKTASDLVCYSYCSNNSLPTRRFTSTPEDPEKASDVTNQVKLLDNIDMAGVTWWTPINVFHGIFDGNGKTIDNLVYSYSGEGVTGSDDSKEIGGIFNEFGGNGTSAGRSSILKDLTIGIGCDFRLSCTKTSGVCIVGGIAARVGYGSIIKNVTNKAYVLMSSDQGSSKKAYNGGVVGLFQGSKIANVTVEGQSQFRIDGDTKWNAAVAASPLCGVADGQTSVLITDCSVAEGAEFIGHMRTYVNYAVETKKWVAGNLGISGFGGIVGMIGQQKHSASSAKIVNCTNAAKLSTGWWTEKYNEITTTRTTSIAIDYNRSIVSNLGGIVGMIGHKSNQTGVTVQNCSNTGTIILSGYAQQGNNTHSTAGGIVGLSLSSGSVFDHLENSGEIILHGQQVGYLGGVIGALVPNSTNGDWAYFSGKTATAQYLVNHGTVDISGTKTYFKHGDTEHICLGGLVGFAIGQAMESGTPEYQEFSHCYNDGLVVNYCSGGDTAANYAFDLGGCFGRVGTCTFDDVINFGNVENRQAHGACVSGFIGGVNTDIVISKDDSPINYVNQMKFTNCGQYGNILIKDVSKTDTGAWIGWTSRASSHFDPACSSNKLSFTFGVYGDTGNQTTVTGSNYSTVIKQTDVAHDEKTTLRLFEGSNGPVNTDVFNSFGYGAKPGTPEYQTANLSYLSFNLRLDTDDDSGVRAWSYRKSGVVTMLNSIKPDIFGLQEVNDGQYSYIVSGLDAGYSVVKGHNDVDNNWIAQLGGEAAVEYKPIFYKSNKFTVVSSGTFWLSRTPDTQYSDTWYWASGDTDTEADPYASTGSSVSNDKPRIAVWAIFQDKASGKKVFVLNTHFPKKAHSVSDENNNHCWTKCSSLIAAKIAELSQGLPVIIGGDFNIEENNKRLTPIKDICSDVRKSAVVTDSVKSYHNWKRADQWQGNIDHIYCRSLDARKFQTITSAYAGIDCLSDHYPIYTEYYL